jgi:hypothetical protein
MVSMMQGIGSFQERWRVGGWEGLKGKKKIIEDRGNAVHGSARPPFCIL